MTKTELIARLKEKYKVTSHKGYIVVRHKDGKYLDTLHAADWKVMK